MSLSRIPLKGGDEQDAFCSRSVHSWARISPKQAKRKYQRRMRAVVRKIIRSGDEP